MKPEKILGKKFVRGKPYYKVKWEGAPKQQATWQSPPALLKYKGLINKYEVKHWGSTLDEKFFDPDNYLTKGFPKKKMDKKEVKQEKRDDKKKKQKHRVREDKQRIAKKYEEEDIQHTQSSEYLSDEDQSDERGPIKHKGPEISSQQTETYAKNKRKTKKNDKKNKKQPQICILDSETEQHLARQRPEQESHDDKDNRKQYLKCKKVIPEEDSQELNSRKNQQIPSVEKSSDIVEIINPADKQKGLDDLFRIEEKGQKPDQIDQFQQSNTDTNKKISKVSQDVPNQENISNKYIFQINQFTHKDLGREALTKVHKQLGFNRVQVLNLSLPPQPAPKIVRMYHLQKMTERKHLYLLEYTNGNMMKMDTSEMLENHPEQLVSFLQKKLKMKQLCS